MRKSHDVGKTLHKCIEMLRARNSDADRSDEIVPIFRPQLFFVMQARMEERIRSADGIVDLVRHHPDELLVRRFLGLAQLLRKLFKQIKRSRKTSVKKL